MRFEGTLKDKGYGDDYDYYLGDEDLGDVLYKLLGKNIVITIQINEPKPPPNETVLITYKEIDNRLGLSALDKINKNSYIINEGLANWTDKLELDKEEWERLGLNGEEFDYRS